MNFHFALLQAATTTGSALPMFMFQIAAIFAIFYFLLIRPQQKQKKAHDDRLRQLKRGEEIVTAGGIVGEIVHIKETMRDGTSVATMEDKVTIRSGESKLIVERGRIARIVTAQQAVTKTDP
jgi:preprotein translocase subunit YajC